MQFDKLFSLALVGFLVGCGGGGGGSSSSDSNNTQPTPIKPVDKNETKPLPVENNITKPQDINKTDGNQTKPSPVTDKNVTITKKVTVTDDYVISASVTDLAGNKAISLEEIGQYGFKKYDNGIIKSTGGNVDSNGNGKIDENEPKALTMYADSKKTYINPFTTLSATTAYSDEQIANLFSIANIDINTNTDDVKVRKAIIYANAILGEAQSRGDQYKPTSVTPITPTPSPDSGATVLPRASVYDDPAPTTQTIIDQKYAWVMQAVQNRLSSNMDLGKAISNMTGNTEYENLPNDINAINNFIQTENIKFNTNPYSGGNPTNNPNPVEPTPINPTPTPGDDYIPPYVGGGGSGTKPDPITPTPEPIITIEKTQDGYKIAKIESKSAKIDKSANVIRIDKVAFFIKDSTDNTYKAPGFDHDIYPPNPPAFPSSLKTTSDVNDGDKIVLDLSNVDRKKDGSFKFTPTNVDYK